MPARLSLVPDGLRVEHCHAEPTLIVVHARPAAAQARCPRCATPSTSLHSRYTRTLHDLPAQGRAVRLVIRARRFRCRHGPCPQRVFTERLDAAHGPHARSTPRLATLVYHLGLALGGRPGARFANRLGLPASADTLLRRVRQGAMRPPAPRIAGIDDFAWRRNHRYGTIICDLERRCVVDLLPDRVPATVTAWLRERPGIAIIARDRGGGYGEAARRALPDALQIADRWHLFENASSAFLDVVRRHLREVRAAFASGVPDPALLTSAERLCWQNWHDRHAINEGVLRLRAQGASLKSIARRTGLARQTVKRIVRGTRDDVFRVRASSLDAWQERLERGWAEGCRNGSALWRAIRAQGFGGSLRVVSEWATRKRRDEAMPAVRPRKAPSARTLARLLTIERDSQSAEAALLVTQALAAAPALAEARGLLDRFHAMIRARRPERLEGWLTAARSSGLASFANGLAGDIAAVRAAITEPWSNGQTEGQITKLKLVKRMMYGRAKLDLLRARLVAG